MTKIIYDAEYKESGRAWTPAGKSFGEIHDEVMRNAIIQQGMTKQFDDRGYTRTFSIHDIIPMFYPGIADYQLYVDIRIADAEGRNISLQQGIYLGAYLEDRFVREAIPNAQEYYDATHNEISDILMKSVNKK